MMRTHYSADVSSGMNGNRVVLCGWVHEKRDLGNLKFIVLRDREGFIQISMKKNVSSDALLSMFKDVSKESVIKVDGIVRADARAPNGREINPTAIDVVSLASTPMPLDVTEKVDAEIDTRLNDRVIDLRKPNISSIFKIRSEILKAGRMYLDKSGFLEIHTPKIIASASEGGTELFPISYFDKEAFLAQSPQLYKQMMMATGFDRVYEVAYYFRAEEHATRRHLNETVAFDVEISFIDSEEDLMNVLDGLMRSLIESASVMKKELDIRDTKISVPQEKIRRFAYDELLDLLEANGRHIEWGEDLDTAAEKLLGKIIEDKYGIDLYFITKYPLKIKPFYTMPDGEEYSRSFDLEYKGIEVSSGGQRIHDYNMLVEQIKNKGMNEKKFESYLNAFKYGMPPHGGFGLGVDRVMMQLLNTNNIREVVLFPRDRFRITP